MNELKNLTQKGRGKLKQMQGSINQKQGGMKGAKGGLQKMVGKLDEVMADAKMQRDKDPRNRD